MLTLQNYIFLQTWFQIRRCRERKSSLKVPPPISLHEASASLPDELDFFTDANSRIPRARRELWRSSGGSVFPKKLDGRFTPLSGVCSLGSGSDVSSLSPLFSFSDSSLVSLCGTGDFATTFSDGVSHYDCCDVSDVSCNSKCFSYKNDKFLMLCLKTFHSTK